MAVIGRQIENPFGEEVNDLPLDAFCQQIAADLDIISSSPAPKPSEFMKKDTNMLLYPLSGLGYHVWASRTDDEIREALTDKVYNDFERKTGRPIPDGPGKNTAMPV
jgi:putative membrane protein